MKKLFNKLFGGKTERDTDDVDGGVKKHIDRNAPKIIESTNLTDFSCKFSLTSYFHDGAKDGFDGLFNLSASLSEGKVTGKYVHTRTRAEHVSASFEASEELLAELEKIIREENLASLNGLETFTSGLPDFYGASLHAEYASGELIYTSNNQDIELPMSALRRFKSAFDGALKTNNSANVINPALKAVPTVPMEAVEDFDAGWVCECGAVNGKDAKNCSACGKKKEGEPKAECICGLKFYGKLPPFCPCCGEKTEQ